MPGSLSRPAQAILIVLLLTVVNASASNHGSIVTNTNPNPNGVAQDPSPNTLVDCSAYSAARTSPSAAHATNGPQSTALFSNASIPQGSVSFEEYWCKYFDQWQVGNPIEDGLEGLFKGLAPGSKSICLPLEKAQYSSWAATSTVSPWTPIMSSPCCDTYCDIHAQAAQLYYWPTTSTPHVTTMIGEGGFTFTYPSVYLVYIDISATGPCGDVGSTYTRLTQAFAPGDLRTVPIHGNMGQASTLNPSDLFGNCTARAPHESYTRPACATQVGGPDNQIGGLANLPSCQAQLESIRSKALSEQLHCYPSLYYPTTRLGEADPAWTTCLPPKWQPMFDPPRILGLAAAMAPIQSSASHQPVAAVPAQIVEPPGASRTPPPSKPELIPGSGNDPSGKGPPSQDPQKNDFPSGDPPMHSASAGNLPANDPPASDPPADKPLASGPRTNDPPANDPLTGKPPANFLIGNVPAKGHSGNNSPNPPSQEPPKNDFPSGDPPMHSASASNPPASDPPAGYPPANDPLTGKPPADFLIGNVPANGHSGNGSPIQDPQNGVKPTQNPSKDRSQYPRPSFAIPIPEGPTLPGIVINPSLVVVAGSTIRPGASAVQIQDHQVSLDPGAPNVVVDGQAHVFPTTSSLPVAWGNNIDTPVSLGTSGPVIGSSTGPTGLLSSTVATGDVGGYIFSGFNGGVGSPSATSPVAFLGSGARLKVRWSACTIVMSIVISFT